MRRHDIAPITDGAAAVVLAADPATAMLSMLAIERLITMCGFR
ncbi:Uncharacterised protein [Mycobacterium tuberculosis]|nr:Uncharacterised protein [Mycobacterium tuberculosis]